MITDEAIAAEAERRELLGLAKDLQDKLDLLTVPVCIKTSYYIDPYDRNLVQFEFMIQDDHNRKYMTVLALCKATFENPIHLRQIVSSALTRLGMLLICGNAKFDGVALYRDGQ